MAARETAAWPMEEEAPIYPNDTIRALLERKSTRRFSSEAIDPGLLELVVSCGDKAPSALGKRDPLLVACTDAKANRSIGKISRELANERERGLASHVSDEQPSIVDDPSIEDAFYGAPAMVYAFSRAGWEFAREDASIAADAMMVAAGSLGIASCYVSRAVPTFANGLPRAWAREHGVPEDYEGAFCLCLGYPA